MNEVAGAFLGIGGMTLFFVGSYLLYQYTRLMKSEADVQERYCAFECATLDKTAIKKGIDINKAVLRNKLFDVKSKSIRKLLEEEVKRDIFKEK